MTAKKAVVRRAAGAALALVLALAVAGPVAAGKKPPPTTGDKTPPTTPTNLRATSVGQTSVTLAWDASTDNSGSFTYSVNKDGQGFTVPQAQTSYTIDWLSAGRTYTFYVTAVDRQPQHVREEQHPSRSRRCRTRWLLRPRPSRGSCEAPRRSG